MLKVLSWVRGNKLPEGRRGDEIRKRIFNEEACKRCGLCCYQTFKISGKYYIVPELPCKYLVSVNNGSMGCAVYSRRDQIGWCHYVTEKNIRRGLFPPGCAYVEGIPDYVGKVPADDVRPENIRKKLKRIAKTMIKPEHISTKDWENFKRSMGL